MLRLFTTCSLMCSLAVPVLSAAAEPLRNDCLHVASVKMLSDHGSTRATFYPQTNKIVTLDARTHNAWLDSISETMIATYHHASGEWSQPVHVGSGHDNHGGPALSCDSNGYLHIVFGPHHGPFQHCRSATANDSSRWVKLSDFGENGTYPSMVCDENDTFHIIYRGGGGNPRKLVYQRRPKGGQWSNMKELARAPIKSGYTHFHCELAISRDNVLHVSYDIYYSGAATCAGHMQSADRGETWQLADGPRLDLPVDPHSDAFFRRVDSRLRTWNVVCDSQGHPWISVRAPKGLVLYRHDGRQWHSMRPVQRVSPPIPEDEFSDYAAMTLDDQDQLYIATIRQDNVVLLHSGDKGKTFQFLPVFARDKELPHRGLNIERPTGHHDVRIPSFLFSTGEKGPDCYGRGIFNLARAVRLTVKPDGDSSKR